jgi:hypothetical protein
MELIQQRKVQKNVDTAIETLKGCLNILKLANKVNLLLQSNKYYLALMVTRLYRADIHLTNVYRL